MFLAFTDSDQNNDMTLIQARNVVKAVPMRDGTGIQVTVAAHDHMRPRTHSVVGLSLREFITKLEEAGECLNLNIKEYA